MAQTDIQTDSSHTPISSTCSAQQQSY